MTTNRTEELNKLDRTINDAEARIRAASTNLEALDKEILSLCNLEKTLKENLKCLKEKKVVAIAKEFQKAKEDLKKTQNRCNLLKNDREHFYKVAREMDALLKQTKKDIERLQKAIENNVLQFKFEKKNG